MNGYMHLIFIPWSKLDSYCQCWMAEQEWEGPKEFIVDCD